jgi:uncharacterized protein YjiS (DUF1127 family)
MPVDQKLFRTLQVCPKDCGTSLGDSRHIEQEDFQMLYQPRPKIRHASWLRRLFLTVAGAWASLFRARGDVMYLDGMRQDELEDLGLRRAHNGSYRPFGD